MSKSIELSFKPFIIKHKHTFAISSFSRNETPSVQTEIEYDGLIGYGEASLPPYLGETQEDAIRFLSKIDFKKFNNPLEIENILQYVDSLDEENNAAKASVDIALHDLIGKMLNKPLYQYFNLEKPVNSYTSFSIGIGSNEEVNKKLYEAKDFKFLKIKLGSIRDKEIIEFIRSKTNCPLYVDVNQGWKDKHEALKMIKWLVEKNVLLIEQPMPIEMKDNISWLSANSPLPLVADESLRRLYDLDEVKNIYSGINIKLMKSTGLNEAFKMIKKAKDLGLKIMIGCMIETSCNVAAAAHLSSQADWIDLDGPLLINNDNFKGLFYNKGKIEISDLPGLGVSKI